MRCAALVLVAAIGCGDDGAAALDAAAAVPACGDPVVASIDNASAPAAGSSGYVAATAAQLSQLRASLQAAIAGDEPAALRAATSADYQLCRSAALFRWRPLDPGLGRATIVWRSGPARGLIVGAPHPEFETNSLDESRRVFEQVEARALIVAGTHRCANPDASACSGTSSVCGASGPYRQSDMAHVVDSAYHAAHQVLAAAFGDGWVVSLHGMSGVGASLSNGTTAAIAADAPVALLAAALAEQFPSDAITTCNSYPGASVEERLCGTTNVQGRALNGAAEACTNPGTTPSQRFIHLEQSPDVRKARQRVVDAFDAVVPPL